MLVKCLPPNKWTRVLHFRHDSLQGVFRGFILRFSLGRGFEEPRTASLNQNRGCKFVPVPAIKTLKKQPPRSTWIVDQAPRQLCTYDHEVNNNKTNQKIRSNPQVLLPQLPSAIGMSPRTNGREGARRTGEVWYKRVCSSPASKISPPNSLL